MLCLMSSVSCVSKPARSAAPSAATTRCQVDCVIVSRAFVKEHADLFDEVIRCRAALKLAHEKAAK